MGSTGIQAVAKLYSRQLVVPAIAPPLEPHEEHQCQLPRQGAVQSLGARARVRGRGRSQPRRAVRATSLRCIKSTKSEGTPGVEMVTVPRFGAEWKQDELRAMTKSGRAEAKREARADRWKRWNRDEAGCCGSWGRRKTLVFVLFGLCVVCVAPLN